LEINGTDEQSIIDILCTKNAFEINELKKAYKKSNVYINAHL